MKISVSKFINARIGLPHTEATCISYRTPGEVLEIDDIITGTLIDGNSIWYHCKDDNCFYWSGGFEDTAFSINKSLTDYNAKDQELILATVQNDKESWLNKHVKGYMGSAIGMKNDDPSKGNALVIYVDSKNQDPTFQIPKQFIYKGITLSTDVKPIMTAVHHIYQSPKHPPTLLLDNDSPLQMGGSISSKGSKSYGTRGLRAFKNKKCYLLTCFHVLLDDLKAQGNYHQEDGKKRYATYPFHSRNFQQIKLRELEIEEGKYSSSYDYAAARLLDENDVCNSINAKSFAGFYDTTDVYTLKGKLVFTVGATSGFQQGTVYDTNASVHIPPNPFSFTNIITTERISDGGDSGAPVTDENNKLVGIIIGGNNVDKTFIMPIYKIVYLENYIIF